MNPRSDNNETIVDFEANALDIKSGIEFLRRQPGITKVLLFGHSGGGPATSFYQAVAENGPGYCQGPNKIVECGSNLAGLQKADGIVFMDAHPGISINGLRSLNPAVLDEMNPRRIDPSLDPFSTKNGYNPNGPSHYSDDFKKRYFKAQSDRMNHLIDFAKTKQQRMKAGEDTYPDDDVFVIPRGEGARLMELDMSIHHSTAKPRKLLKNDGTIVTQIVDSVRRPAPELNVQNASFKNGTRIFTLRSFLSANAIRSGDSMDNIDWCSSNNSTDCALKSISVPVLVTAMGAHYFIRDSEFHYEMAASKDKEFIVIEGATHGGTPCKPCESTLGQYSNTVKNFFDYVAKWINARY
jgi:pimeloyl-ACP methyl ester carboxylesterase